MLEEKTKELGYKVRARPHEAAAAALGLSPVLLPQPRVATGPSSADGRRSSGPGGAWWGTRCSHTPPPGPGPCPRA